MIRRFLSRCAVLFLALGLAPPVALGCEEPVDGTVRDGPREWLAEGRCYEFSDPSTHKDVDVVSAARAFCASVSVDDGGAWRVARDEEVRAAVSAGVADGVFSAAKTSVCGHTDGTYKCSEGRCFLCTRP